MGSMIFIFNFRMPGKCLKMCGDIWLSAGLLFVMLVARVPGPRAKAVVKLGIEVVAQLVESLVVCRW